MSMDRAMQLVQGSCECHLDGTDVRRAPSVGGGTGNAAGAAGAGVGVGVSYDDEDGLDEDEVFGTAALLQYRANLRHPLVQPNSELDAFLNSTRWHRLHVCDFRKSVQKLSVLTSDCIPENGQKFKNFRKVKINSRNQRKFLGSPNKFWKSIEIQYLTPEINDASRKAV